MIVENRSSTGKKGGRKTGRSSVKCARYRAAGTREKNKARRLEARLKRFAKKRGAIDPALLSLPKVGELKARIGRMKVMDLEVSNGEGRV